MAGSDLGGPDASANVIAVRRLRLFHRLGDVERMLTLIHPDVVWRPLTRTERATYEGHDGVRAMLWDLTRANRPYEIEYDAIREPAKDVVEADARIVTLEAELRIRFVFRMLDELVREVDVYSRDE